MSLAKQLQMSLQHVRATQCARLLTLLRSKEWVGLPEILDLRIAKYSSRITNLRHAGFIIENRKERAPDGVIHSWYRLLHEPGSTAAMYEAQK